MLSRLQSPTTLQQRPSAPFKPSFKPFSSSPQRGKKAVSLIAAAVHQNSSTVAAASPQQQQQKQKQQQQQRGVTMRSSSAASPAAAAEPAAAAADEKSFICTSITASTVEGFLQEMQEAAATGRCRV
jgi:hemolysin activation/secretion protein